jgi:polysaccharide export outer membrane protein
MLRKLFFVLIALITNSCTILPGMQNIDTHSMPVHNSSRSIQAEPVVTPITPAYLIQNPSEEYIYRVAPQDVLSIIIWNHAEFNASVPAAGTNANLTTQSAGAPGYLINHDGNIYFPLVGYLHVAGKSIEEIHRILARRLSVYVPKPQIFIRVADFRSKKIYVMGEVLKAGFLPLNDQPISITSALNQTGSLDPNSSDPRHIYVIRGSFIRPEIYWLNASMPTALLLGERFQLRDNDVVIVSTAAVTRWNRFLNQLLPSLQTVWYTKAVTGK